MPSIRILPVLGILLVVFPGCLSHRLDGPLYLADGPPFVAGDRGVEAAPLDLDHRLILIGDAGLYHEDDETLAELGRWASLAPASTAVYLGDNVYNEGLVDDDRDRGERILAQQLEATPRRKIFIPGNHDWGFSPKGMNARAIANQQTYIDEWPAGNAEFIPREGCMGPATRVLHDARGEGKNVVLVSLDPTPWINPLLRNACGEDESQASVLARLDDVLTRHADDWVIVATHYPMLSGGPHGGLTYGAIGDVLVGFYAWSFGGVMNTYEPNYADWISRTQAVLRKHPPLIYAAGHDHSLQLLEAGDVAELYVVSGAGAKGRVTTVTNVPETIFAHASEGIVVVDFGRRGDDEVVVVRVVEARQASPVYEMELP